MAYFPNCTSGIILDEQCLECIHEDPDAGCPITLVQMEYNYIQVGNIELRDAMNMLIDEKGNCLMKPFIDALKTPKPKDTQLNLFD